jgi:hypothetical protein
MKSVETDFNPIPISETCSGIRSSTDFEGLPGKGTGTVRSIVIDRMDDPSLL